MRACRVWQAFDASPRRVAVGGWEGVGGGRDNTPPAFLEEAMHVIDPGHSYLLDSLDGEQSNHLVFVKREGPGYPGNVGHHPGTNMQEVLRALIERAEYLYEQIPCTETHECIQLWKRSLWLLEKRAAERHGREPPMDMKEIVSGECKCPLCGHVGCDGTCHSGVKP